MVAMQVISLQSGSNGNCIYVEAAGRRLLFDAGISGKTAETRLAQHGRDIRQVDGVLISHDHSDHTRSMGIFQRKFGLPVYVGHEAYYAASRRCCLGPLDDIRAFHPGATLDLDGVLVHTIPTPHDGIDGVCFVVEAEGRRLGILTDLGHVFDGLRDLVASLDAVLIESNYDPRMLDVGGYPYVLKRRIRGPGGHLSNGEAAEVLAAADRSLRWACLGHLSQENNTPELAMETHRRRLGDRFALHLARRDCVGECLTV